jgi:hypothetical protein
MNTETNTVDILAATHPLAALPSDRFRKEDVADHVLKAIRIEREKAEKDKRL